MEFYLKEIFEPEQLLKSQVGKEDYVKGAINYVIVPAIVGLIMGLVAFIGSLFSGNIAAISLSAVSIIGLPILAIIIVLIVVAIVNFFIWLGMKINGSTASYLTQFYMTSVVLLPIMIYLVGFMVASMICMLLVIILIGIPLYFILMAILIGFGMFMEYLTWITLKSIHKLDNVKQILGIATGLAIPAIIIGIIVIIMILLFGLAVGSAADVMQIAQTFNPEMMSMIKP